jgi:hypothetical protein
VMSTKILRTLASGAVGEHVEAAETATLSCDDSYAAIHGLGAACDDVATQALP